MEALAIAIIVVAACVAMYMVAKTDQGDGVNQFFGTGGIIALSVFAIIVIAEMHGTHIIREIFPQD